MTEFADYIWHGSNSTQGIPNVIAIAVSSAFYVGLLVLWNRVLKRVLKGVMLAYWKYWKQAVVPVGNDLTSTHSTNLVRIGDGEDGRQHGGTWETFLYDLYVWTELYPAVGPFDPNEHMATISSGQRIYQRLATKRGANTKRGRAIRLRHNRELIDLFTRWWEASEIEEVPAAYRR